MTNQLQNILSAYEEAPPERNWKMIAEKLDEDGIFDSDRLYHYEQQPDNAVWDKIQSHLKNSGEESAIVKQLNPRRDFLKYGIAAAILILLSVAAVNYFNAPSKEILANNKEVKPAVDSPISEETGNNNEGITKTDDPENTTNTSTKNSKNANRYVTVANVDGKKVRLSKKAYTVFNCAENDLAVNNSNCKESIQNVRKKMAASMLSSSGDFGGLMDLIKNLEENN